MRFKKNKLLTIIIPPWAYFWATLCVYFFEVICVFLVSDHRQPA